MAIYKSKYTGEELEKALDNAQVQPVRHTPQTLTEEQKAQARTNIGAATAESVNQLSEQVVDEKTAREACDAVLSARMDTFTALPEGSTTGDAELIDGRVDKDGVTHHNIGEHIRNVTGQLSEEKVDKTSIAQKTGDSTDMVMSQKAVTKAVDAIKGILVDEKEVKETITDGMAGYEYKPMTELDISKKAGTLYLNYKGVNNTETAIVDVSEGEIFYISGVTKYNEGTYPAVSLLFTDGTSDNYISPDDAGYDMFLGSKSTDYTYISNYKVEVPTGAKKMYVCSILIDDDSEKIVIEKATPVLHPNEIITSVLYGKQAIFVGDSICHDSPHNSEGWAKRIADRYGMTYVNYGKDGATIANNVYFNGNLKACIATRIDTLIAQYPDADYIVIEGGTNDADLIGSILNDNIPEKLGSVQRGYNATFDEDTFCGALESIFSKCSREWRGKHIGYVVAQKMGRNADGYTPEVNNRRAYFEKAMQICEKWGIPYINLWDESYLNPMIIEHYNADLSAEENESAGNLYRDGQHLTPKAYDYLAVKIGEWMKTL